MEARLGSLVRRLRAAGGGAMGARIDAKLDEVLHRLDTALLQGRMPDLPAAPAPSPPPSGHVIELDYPVHPRPRFGFGQPSHPRLA